MNEKFIKYVIEEDEELIKFIPEYTKTEEHNPFVFNINFGKPVFNVDKDLWNAVVKKLKEDLEECCEEHNNLVKNVASTLGTGDDFEQEFKGE